MSNFKVNDLCDFTGLGVVVVDINDRGHYPLTVRATGGDEYYFTIDGRSLSIHTKPSLVLKHRPKKKVALVRWLNVYFGGSLSLPFDTKSEADERAGAHRIACVQVTGEYEVEDL